MKVSYQGETKELGAKKRGKNGQEAKVGRREWPKMGSWGEFVAAQRRSCADDSQLMIAGYDYSVNRLLKSILFRIEIFLVEEKAKRRRGSGFGYPVKRAHPLKITKGRPPKMSLLVCGESITVINDGS